MPAHLCAHLLLVASSAFVSVRALPSALCAPTREVRYYLLSRVLSAQQFGAAVRSHWGIENQVHWVLDVTFGEDQSRIRAGHAAENVVALRHIALNLLRHAPAPGRAKTPSLKAKRLRAGWDTSYLLRVLSAV